MFQAPPPCRGRIFEFRLKEFCALFVCDVTPIGAFLDRRMAPRQKSRERYERSRPKCSEDTVLLAARGVDLQVAGADGRRVSRAVPDL